MRGTVNGLNCLLWMALWESTNACSTRESFPPAFARTLHGVTFAFMKSLAEIIERDLRQRGVMPCDPESEWLCNNLPKTFDTVSGTTPPSIIIDWWE